MFSWELEGGFVLQHAVEIMPDLLVVLLGDDPNLGGALDADFRPELLIVFADKFRHGVGVMQRRRLDDRLHDRRRTCWGSNFT